MCTRAEISDFGREAFALGIRYLGCAAARVRTTSARSPRASVGIAGQSLQRRHVQARVLGTDKKIRKIQTDYQDKA